MARKWDGKKYACWNFHMFTSNHMRNITLTLRSLDSYGWSLIYTKPSVSVDLRKMTYSQMPLRSC